MSRVHRYAGEDVVVEFDLSRCIHAGDCTRGLPDVFNTKRSGRWVHPDEASSEEVARSCAACPTGALRCMDKASGEAMQAAPPQENTVQMVEDGPLYVHAAMSVDGKPEPTHRAALCRCGASRLMPYCDESHKTIAFSDSGKALCPMPGEAGEAGALKISTAQGGPLMIEGPFTLLYAEGHAICRSRKAALCRCGASKMRPYCDGSHNQIDFESE
ncbi:MAG: CDGSH iron-sulfur domain-containing protein [Mariprofundaceae bacterium]|nr:CDGSH iron-sulfur domain-containing protein [Mariprofundaceae bacterium]